MEDEKAKKRKNVEASRTQKTQPPARTSMKPQLQDEDQRRGLRPNHRQHAVPVRDWVVLYCCFRHRHHRRLLGECDEGLSVPTNSLSNLMGRPLVLRNLQGVDQRVNAAASLATAESIRGLRERRAAAKGKAAKGKAAKHKFTTNAELRNAIGDYISQGCQNESTCRATFEYGGAVSRLLRFPPDKYRT